MSTKTQQQFFGLACPTGGIFYICGTNPDDFIGCCTTDPCAKNPASGGSKSSACPAANLRPASYDPPDSKVVDEVPRQGCEGDSKGEKLWFSCKKSSDGSGSGSGRFVGCCAVDPCGVSGKTSTCPQKELRAARLSGDSERRNAFLFPGGLGGSGSGLNGTAGGAGSSSGSGPSGNGTLVASDGSGNGNGTIVQSGDGGAGANGGGGLSRGAIGGICVGVAVVVILIVAMVMFRCGWHARRKEEREETAMPSGAVHCHNFSTSSSPSPCWPVKESLDRDSCFSVTTTSLAAPTTPYSSPVTGTPPSINFDAIDLASLHRNPYFGFYSLPSSGRASPVVAASSSAELPDTAIVVQELPAPSHSRPTTPRAGAKHSGLRLVAPESPVSGPSTPFAVTPVVSPQSPVSSPLGRRPPTIIEQTSGG